MKSGKVVFFLKIQLTRPEFLVDVPPFQQDCGTLHWPRNIKTFEPCNPKVERKLYLSEVVGAKLRSLTRWPEFETVNSDKINFLLEKQSTRRGFHVNVHPFGKNWQDWRRPTSDFVGPGTSKTLNPETQKSKENCICLKLMMQNSGI